jgi:uncharacterized membrane protein
MSKKKDMSVAKFMGMLGVLFLIMAVTVVISLYVLG